MKKAYELSILTGAQVLLLVVSETNVSYTYATAKLQPLVHDRQHQQTILNLLNAPDVIGPDGEPSYLAPCTMPQAKKGKDGTLLKLRPLKLKQDVVDALRESGRQAREEEMLAEEEMEEEMGFERDEDAKPEIHKISTQSHQSLQPIHPIPSELSMPPGPGRPKKRMPSGKVPKKTSTSKSNGKKMTVDTTPLQPESSEASHVVGPPSNANYPSTMVASSPPMLQAFQSQRSPISATFPTLAIAPIPPQYLPSGPYFQQPSPQAAQYIQQHRLPSFNYPQYMTSQHSIPPQPPMTAYQRPPGASMNGPQHS